MSSEPSELEIRVTQANTLSWAADQLDAKAKQATQGGVESVLVSMITGCARDLREMAHELRRGWYRRPPISRDLDPSARVLLEILGERDRQNARNDVRWGEQDHPDGIGRLMDPVAADVVRRAAQRAAAAGTLTWRHMLSEELGVAYAAADPPALRAALIQIAAISVAWAEAIDRRAQAQGGES